MTDYDLSKIKDPRIGVFSSEYAIVKKPTQYATGAQWQKSDNSSPTRVGFGEDMRFFYYLPVRMPRLKEEIVAELEAIIEAARVTPKATPKAEVIETAETGDDKPVVKRDNAPRLTSKPAKTEEE